MKAMAHFSPDPFWFGVAAAALWFYLNAFGRVRRTDGTPFPAWRAGFFFVGVALVLLATVTPLEHYGNQAIWVNFAGFLVLTMIAAPLLVLGSPLTLAFRVTGPTGRRRLRALYRSRIASILTFPMVTWLGFAVLTYVWQFSSLTETAAREPLVRDVQQATLLGVSVLFWLPALSSDPLRWRMNHPLRVFYVGVEMVHKGLFGGMFLSMSSPFHEEIAANLPSWAPSPMMDQRIGILILWIGGNLIFVTALIFLIRGWMAYEVRNAARTDRRLALAAEARKKHRAALDKVFHRA